MSRRPVHLVVAEANGKPYGRRGMWQVMRELKVFSVMQIYALMSSGTRLCAIVEYLRVLRTAGYVELAEDVKKISKRCHDKPYRLVHDCGVDAPRLRKDGTESPPSGQQNMWVAMRILKEFTSRELMTAASTKETPINLSAAQWYTRNLHAIGYLSCIRDGDEKRYRHVRDTGGLAPIIQSTKCVFDPNLNRIVGHEVIEP